MLTQCVFPYAEGGFKIPNFNHFICLPFTHPSSHRYDNLSVWSSRRARSNEWSHGIFKRLQLVKLIKGTRTRGSRPTHTGIDLRGRDLLVLIRSEGVNVTSKMNKSSPIKLLKQILLLASLLTLHTFNKIQK